MSDSVNRGTATEYYVKAPPYKVPCDCEKCPTCGGTGRVRNGQPPMAPTWTITNTSKTAPITDTTTTVDTLGYCAKKVISGNL